MPDVTLVSLSILFAMAACAPSVSPRVVRPAAAPTAADPGADAEPPVDPSKLVTRGHADGREPPLANVVEALGYAIDVNPLDLGLMSKGGWHAAGDEIPAPLFRRAGAAPVVLKPVARFSADGPLVFGHYDLLGDHIATETVATLSPGRNQTLNPPTESGGQIRFDPGRVVFGLWARLGTTEVYSDPERNADRAAHMRVYPLRVRSGEAVVTNAYLVAIKVGTDATGDRDFQDCVLVVRNVTPTRRGEWVR
jgi:hypothetical protein